MEMDIPTKTMMQMTSITADVVRDLPSQDQNRVAGDCADPDEDQPRQYVLFQHGILADDICRKPRHDDSVSEQAAYADPHKYKLEFLSYSLPLPML